MCETYGIDIPRSSRPRRPRPTVTLRPQPPSLRTSAATVAIINHCLAPRRASSSRATATAPPRAETVRTRAAGITPPLPSVCVYMYTYTRLPPPEYISLNLAPELGRSRHISPYLSAHLASSRRASRPISRSVARVHLVEVDDLLADLARTSPDLGRSRAQSPVCILSTLMTSWPAPCTKSTRGISCARPSM